MAKILEGPGGVGVSFLLMILFLLPRPTEFLPIYPDSDSGRDIRSWRKQCVDPEECCIFARDENKFEECCKDHGCCPLSCRGTQEGASDFVLSEHCNRGWECCRFRPQTPEYDMCCSAHGCCPPCGQVSRGCCYNKVLYEWGRTVEEFPELCLRLVCAVQAKTFFSAVIVPTRQPAHLCHGGGTWCDDCIHYHCVDETGLVRGEGDRWFVEECEECLCRDGSVICQRLDASCPPKPHGYCVEVPGLCCPEWNCKVPESLTLPISGRMNEDENDPSLMSIAGIYSENDTGIMPRLGMKWGLSSVINRLFGHKLRKSHIQGQLCILKGQKGKEWATDDPCVLKVCTEEGIQKKAKPCNMTVPQHPDCQEFTPEGKCCPEWNCSGCFGENGTFHSVGSEWGSENPCNIMVCTEDGIEERPEECEETPTPGPNCFAHIPEGECCEQWNCSGCLDDQSEFHPLGDLWQGGPCSMAVCTEDGVFEIGEKCHSEPKPEENCEEVVPEGGCCPEWSCGGCWKDGQHYEIGSESSTEDPCITLLCTEDGMEMRRQSCGWTSRPSTNCFLQKPEGECCEKWNCSGCEHNGTFRELGSEWPSEDACNVWHCSELGVEKNRKSCKWKAPPHPNCFYSFNEGECCGEWNCSGCYEGGVYHEVGSEWITSHPCIASHCTEEGITKKFVSCSWTPSPHPNCFIYTPEGECCEKWNCSGCLENDMFYPLTHEWKTDRCTKHVCTSDGVQTKREECSWLGTQPHPGCKMFESEEECCPRWICSGPDQSSLSGPDQSSLSGPDQSSLSGPDQSSLGDPDQSSPSGCYKDGKYHELGRTFTLDDPCVIFTCTEEGIDMEKLYCNWIPPPHTNCFDDAPDDCCCCQSWNCSGCLDDSGTYFPLNHIWKSENCTSNMCTEYGIIESAQEMCQLGPRPHPTCKKVRPLGGCCEEWSCSGCLENGMYYPLTHEWKTDRCTKHVCTSDGVQTKREECRLGPQPRPGCKIFESEEECCPRWICSGCYKDGKHYELGSEFSTDDPCVVFTCTEEGLDMSEISCDWNPPPQLNCFADTADDACCKVWNCSGCLDDSGAYFPLGHLWEAGNCTTNMCTEYGVQTTREECELGPRPHYSCQRVLPLGKCCAEWNCSGCFDREKNFYELGSKTSSDNPCIDLRCSEEGLHQEHKSCVWTKQPYPICFEYTPEGECCKKWNCSGCVDEDGTYYPMFHIMRTDPCITSICTYNGIQTTPEFCDLGPAPHGSCKKMKLPDKCCPEWDCSVFHGEDGTVYELGSETETNDPCVILLCTEAGLEEKRETCPWKLPSTPTCFAYVPEGKCCEEWNCSGCIDHAGAYHALNEVWNSDPCTTHRCLSDRIKTNRETCETSSPHSSCRQYTPEGECCPKWDCSATSTTQSSLFSGCVDSSGMHKFGDKWEDPSDSCTELECGIYGRIIKHSKCGLKDIKDPVFQLLYG